MQLTFLIGYYHGTGKVISNATYKDAITMITAINDSTGTVRQPVLSPVCRRAQRSDNK